MTSVSKNSRNHLQEEITASDGNHNETTTSIKSLKEGKVPELEEEEEMEEEEDELEENFQMFLERRKHIETEWAFECIHDDSFSNASIPPTTFIAKMQKQDPKAEQVFADSVLWILISEQRNLIIVRFSQPKHRKWLKLFSFIDCATLKPLHKLEEAPWNEGEYYGAHRVYRSPITNSWISKSFSSDSLAPILRFITTYEYHASLMDSLQTGFQEKKKTFLDRWKTQISSGKTLVDIFYGLDQNDDFKLALLAENYFQLLELESLAHHQKKI